jgi:hypothetical protein
MVNNSSLARWVVYRPGGMAAGRPGIALSALVVTGLVAIALLAAAVGNPFSGSRDGGHAIPRPSLDVAPHGSAASPDAGRAPVAGSQESARQAATDATGRVAVGLPSEVVPLSVPAFSAPIARYRRYSAVRARAMTVATGRVLVAARAGDRDAARRAWGDAYEQFARIGAAYGALGALGVAVDARPGSLPGGVHDPRFRGLHAVERELWTGGPLARVEPLAARLDADARRLPHHLATMPIATLDFSLRPHEILEDAQRDELTGGAAQWSGAGLRATVGAYAATQAMLAELAPVLQGRGDVLPPVQHAMARLGRELDAVRTSHGGWPALGRLSDDERERVDGAVGQALEALAAVPGDLETGRPAPIPPIGRR